MFDLALETVLFLAAAAFVAGFVDSIAGGGGMITVPALLLAGLSPVESLATNKLQGLFGAASATISYASKGHVDLRRQLPSAVLSCAGAALGALLATVLPGEWLELVLPFMLIAIALYFALKPSMDDVDRHQRMTPFLFGLVVADEPVSALDVSIRAQILDLFADLNDRLGVAYLFITHDLTVARAITDDVMVMHEGRIVETGRTADVLDDPQSEAARDLVAAAPDLRRAIARKTREQG